MALYLSAEMVGGSYKQPIDLLDSIVICYNWLTTYENIYSSFINPSETIYQCPLNK